MTQYPDDEDEEEEDAAEVRRESGSRRSGKRLKNHIVPDPNSVNPIPPDKVFSTETVSFEKGCIE